MNLEEAIKWAEKDRTSLFGYGGSTLVYYVVPWNDEYCVLSNSHIERHPDIKWIYNTKDKIIMENWKIKYKKGDLVRDAERDFDVIGHGCNCFNNMGAGIAKDVRIKYPEAYKVDIATQMGSKDKLGNYTKWDGENITILNLYTQWKYGNNEIHADYDAIRSCMKSIKEDYPGKKIGLPLIGAGLAGGDFDIIEKIIEEELKGEDVTIVIWERSKEPWQLKLLETNNV